MHEESMQSMRRFVAEYLDPDKELVILDVGSKKVRGKQGTYRSCFNGNKKWKYYGLDLEEGENVDIVSSEMYKYPVKDNEFDVVICGNTMEHVEDIYSFVKELARITKDYLYIDVPNNWMLHRYPVDCWRVMPDGLRFLMEKVAGLKVIFCHRGHNLGGTKNSTIGIARKA